MSFMDQVEEIRNLATSCLANESQFVVDVSMSPKAGSRKLVVVIDSDYGVSIDDCADVSRKLSEALDASELVGDQYLLEVSSPGLDQPLKLNRQYKKNVGRKLKVLTEEATLEGLLEEVGEEGIMISHIVIGAGRLKERVTESIPFASIKKAFVLVSFNKKQ